MNAQQTCGIIAGILSAMAFLPYCLSIWRGPTTPSRTTWIVWMVVGIFLATSYKAGGATHSAWVTYAYVLGPFLVLCLCWKKSRMQWTTLDFVCLIGAGMGGALWAVYNSPFMALAMNILMDFLGLLPTMKKSWREPEKENRLAWTLSAISSFVNLFAITQWELALWLYPVYMLLGNGSICAILWIRKRSQQ